VTTAPSTKESLGELPSRGVCFGFHAAVHLGRRGPSYFGVESGRCWFRYDEDGSTFCLSQVVEFIADQVQ
jgi:hypothetical protein